MKKNICMLFPGNLDESDYIKLSKLNETEIVFITEQEYQKKRAIKSVHRDKTFFCDDILLDKRFDKEESLDLRDLEKIDILFNNLSSDLSLIWIAERTHRKGGLISNFIYTNQLVLIIKKLFLFYKFINPKRLVFSTPPHKVETYILGKIAEFFKIPVLFGNGDAISKTSEPAIGIQDFLIINRRLENTKFINKAKEIINKLNRSYAYAKPDFLKEQEKNRKNEIISYKIDFKNFFKVDNLRKLYTFFSIYQKYKTFKYYNKISKKFILPNKYLVFFLQYQPERTSTPDGDIFAAQVYCINLISSVLNIIKSDVKIIIKEHPAQYTTKWNNTFRDINFYKEIAKFNNVIFAPIDRDSFELIDKALCVSTINGTVIFEAAARGKPTISFGPKSQTFKWHNSHSVNNFDDIYKALSSILQNKDKYVDKNEDIIKSFENYLSEKIANGFETSLLNVSFELFEYLCTCNLKK